MDFKPEDKTMREKGEFPDFEKPKPSLGRRALRTFLEYLFLFIIAFLISMVIRLTTLEAFIVPTGSMQPTINPGDMVLANKLIYRFRNPDRCEVIVFHPPENISKEPYIKRLIGLPGDTVEIKDGDVFVNGEKIVIEDIPRASSNYGPIKIPKDSLFVLGDNRNGSFDSRSWGFANLRDVIGKGFVIYWPPSHWRIL